MNERLLQFIWQHQCFQLHSLLSTTGEPLRILSPGKINPDQGPDFLDARVQVGQMLFAGHIELHVLASDWDLHQHASDPVYGNIVLHVVWQADRRVKDMHDRVLDTLEIQPYVASSLLNYYEKLMYTGGGLPACRIFLPALTPIGWFSWKESLAARRLSRKSEEIFGLLQQTQGHWESVFWQVLARNFGIPKNAEAFAETARTLPLTLLAKHKQNHLQTESLLMGQSGLLRGKLADPYAQMLQKEYHFLSTKYKLQPITLPLLFLRMRPSGFPTVRLAQLAALIRQSTHLFSRILETEDIQDLYRLFNVTANDFWHYHYRLNDEASAYKEKHLGRQMIENIIINTVVPLVFAYGKHKGIAVLQDKALDWLSRCATEKNRIITQWASAGIRASSALESQALLELNNFYCREKKCLECAVGNHILAHKKRDTTMA